jgi:hypothetical protein
MESPVIAQNSATWARIVEYLKEKWEGTPRCPFCHHDSWLVSDKVFELREYHGGTLVVGGVSLVPVIPVTCSHCAYVVFVNALVAGLVPDPATDTNKETG